MDSNINLLLYQVISQVGGDVPGHDWTVLLGDLVHNPSQLGCAGELTQPSSLPGKTHHVPHLCRGLRGGVGVLQGVDCSYLKSSSA